MHWLRGIAVWLCCTLSVSAASAGERPNFVFILVDDLGWRDLGCSGSDFYETPNVDGLAASGVRFTQAYAACPVCSPTRASILTGKYPARMATTDYFGAPQPENWKRNTPLLPASYSPRLPLEEITLAEALREAGYATFFAGKWHLGGEGFHPEDQGFDVNKGGHHRGGPYGGKKYFSPYGNPKLEDGPEGEHLPDRLATETSAFLQAHPEQPVFAYLSFYSVHTPLMSRADLEAKYRRKRQGRAATDAERWGREPPRKLRRIQDHAAYAGMVEAMDQAVGKVLDAIARHPRARETVVIFFSDNGGLATSEGHPTSNLPLRAGKGWLYEGGIREPLIVRWPGHTRPGTTCPTPVISTDFYPTLLEIAGLPPRPEQHRDGRSLVPLLRGDVVGEPRALFWHYPHHGNQGGRPGAAVRLGRYKLIEFFGEDTVQLYDLRVDPGEQHDLAAALPGRVKSMQDRLDRWQEETGARFPTPNPRYEAPGKQAR